VCNFNVRSHCIERCQVDIHKYTRVCYVIMRVLERKPHNDHRKEMQVVNSLKLKLKR